MVMAKRGIWTRVPLLASAPLFFFFPLQTSLLSYDHDTRTDDGTLIIFMNSSVVYLTRYLCHSRYYTHFFFALESD